MNDIQIFNNSEFGAIRTVQINGDVYFIGKDVAEILGYSRPDHAITKHVDDDDKLMYQIDTSGQNRQMFVINESGLYSLILSSKLPTAKKFKHWVTGEILPTIRKHGAYMTEQTLEQALTSPDFLIQLATTVIFGITADGQPLNFQALTVEAAESYIETMTDGRNYTIIADTTIYQGENVIKKAYVLNKENLT